VITRKPKPGSFSAEVERFLETATQDSSEELRTAAPRLDRQLRALDRERGAIVSALLELPAGARASASTLVRRIRALLKAEDEAVFECYWHDLGGEGGA
jgi:hypothetical protein